MHRTSRSISLALLLAAVSVLPGCLDGSTPDCGHPEVSLTLPAGACQAIANACRDGGVWLEGDGLTLGARNTQPYFHVEMQHPKESAIEVQICADPANTPVASLVPQDVLYSTPADDSVGLWTLEINTAPELHVALSGVPDAATPGQTVVLQAKASGGVPPYTYQWGPEGEVSGQGDAATAAPVADSTYVVTVTDSLGQQQRALLTVTVASPPGKTPLPKP
jgi:hypothetical protein